MVNIQAIGMDFDSYSESIKDLVRQAFETCPWAQHIFIFGSFIPADSAYPATVRWTYDTCFDDYSEWSNDKSEAIIYKDDRH